MFTNFKMGVIRCLTCKLPNRVKRIILLSSYYAYLQNINQDDFKGKRFKELGPVVDKFNNLLHISNKKEVLFFPMYVKQLIWSNLIENEKFQYSMDSGSIKDVVYLYKTKRHSDLLAALDDVIKTAPKWLIYTDSHYSLKKDLVKVIEVVSQCRDKEGIDPSTTGMSSSH